MLKDCVFFWFSVDSNTVSFHFIAASAHARAAIYFEIDKEFPCRFVWMDGWMEYMQMRRE